jgi:manganese/zinc/iron transport system substrate-binding protein
LTTRADFCGFLGSSKVATLPLFKKQLFFFLLCFLFGACHTKKINLNKKLTIVCTTEIIADGIRNIVQDSALVISLMGEGVDPHLYKATTGDLEKLYEADLVFYNGLHLEGRMGQILEKLSRLKPTIALAEGIAKQDLLVVDSASHSFDPHIWFDVYNWAAALKYASEKLPLYDNKNKDFYIANTKHYLQKLQYLDSTTKEKIAQIPVNQRLLITSHDAFGYFGRRYQIEVQGLQGISTAAEFGLKDVSDLVKIICNRKIKAIFTETSVSDKSISAVVMGCEAQGHKVSIGGHLFTDAMGAANTPEGTYIGMVQANVGMILAALQENKK